MSRKPDMNFSDQKAVRAALAPLGREAVIAVAVRAALRVAPLLVFDPKLVEDIDRDTKDGARQLALLTTSFAAMAAPWVACTCPAPGAERASVTFRAGTSHAFRAESAAGSASRALSFTASFTASHAFHAASAALSASRAALLTASVASADFAAASVASAVSAASHAARQDALTADLAALRDGQAAQSLAATPLWQNAPSRAARAVWEHAPPEELADAWTRMRTLLLQREGEHWEVWIDWYEARLRGDPPRCDLEIARVEALTEDILKDPIATNRALAAVEALFAARSEPGARTDEVEADEEASTPVRGSAPYVFGAAGGKLTAAPLAGTPDNPGLIDHMHAELLAQAERYRDRMRKTNAPRRVTDTADAVARLLADWPNAPAAVKLWQTFNALEGDCAEYEPAGRRDELPDGALAEMETLARSLEGFVALFPEVREIRLAVRAYQLDFDQTRVFEAKAGELEAGLAAQPDLVAPSALAAIANGKAEVSEAIRRAGAAIDPAQAVKAKAEAARLSAERQLTVGDMAHVLAEEIRNEAPAIEDSVRTLEGDGLGGSSGDDGPGDDGSRGDYSHDRRGPSRKSITLGEFSDDALSNLQRWALANQSMLMDTGLAGLVVLAANTLGPLGFMVGLAYLRKYDNEFARLADWLERLRRAKGGDRGDDARGA